jgi:hypothetical protein
MEVSGQLHVPATLTPGKGPRYLFDGRLGGPQSCSGSGGEYVNTVFEFMIGFIIALFSAAPCVNLMSEFIKLLQSDQDKTK